MGAPDTHKKERRLFGHLFQKGDVWYLRYQDRSGRWCKAKATTEQVVKRLREGRLGAAVEGCHFHNGEFRPLKGRRLDHGFLAHTAHGCR